MSEKLFDLVLPSFLNTYCLYLNDLNWTVVVVSIKIWFLFPVQVQHILASTFSSRCVVWDLRKNEPIIKVSDSTSRYDYETIFIWTNTFFLTGYMQQSHRYVIVQLLFFILTGADLVTMPSTREQLLLLQSTHQYELNLLSGWGARWLPGIQTSRLSSAWLPRMIRRQLFRYIITC